MRGSLGWQDDGESFVPTVGGLLDGLPDTDAGSSLHMFLEPKDIATIRGYRNMCMTRRRGATELAKWDIR